jgi:hypothetical protein
MSTARPARRNGIPATMSLNISGVTLPSSIPVSVIDGQTTFARMPIGPNSRAIAALQAETFQAVADAGRDLAELAVGDLPVFAEDRDLPGPARAKIAPEDLRAVVVLGNAEADFAGTRGVAGHRIRNGAGCRRHAFDPLEAFS